MKKTQYRTYQGILISDNQSSQDLTEIKEDINNIKNDINTLNGIKETFNLNHALYPNNNLLSFVFLDNTRIQSISKGYYDYQLQYITLKNITTINSYCFYSTNTYNPRVIDLTGCPNLAVIASFAFYNCNADIYKLGNLSNLISLRQSAFLNVTAILDFTKADKLNNIGDSVFGSNVIPKKAIHVKFGNNISNITFVGTSFLNCDDNSIVAVPTNLYDQAETKLRAAGFNGIIRGYNE